MTSFLLCFENVKIRQNDSKTIRVKYDQFVKWNKSKMESVIEMK
jgi:hypothetical protein